MIEASDITGVILAGGRGSRMGGVDKGLQNFNGMPMALHALMRLAPQVGEVMINANRNLGAYDAMGVPVWPDALPDYPGPLAGFLTGLERCETPYLVTVPCDSPLFPTDLVARLRRSFEYCGTVVGSVKDAQLGDSVPFFGGRKATRARAVIALAQDWADHYAQAAMYLRANGILPPSARPRP